VIEKLSINAKFFKKIICPVYLNHIEFNMTEWIKLPSELLEIIFKLLLNQKDKDAG
jgi:hypothetical protein